MTAQIHIGCCGWNYLPKDQFPGHGGNGKRRPSILQEYAELFSAVEINSTFYRFPSMPTAAKWRKEAASVNKNFIFTIKAYQGITHMYRFGKKPRPLKWFDVLKNIAAKTKARTYSFNLRRISVRPLREYEGCSAFLIRSTDRV